MAALSAPRGIAHSLHGLRLVALDLGNAEDAIRLLGAASRLFDDIGMVLNAGEKDQYERALAQARQSLGVQLTEELWEAGRATPSASAIDMGRRVSTELVTDPTPESTTTPRRVFRVEGEQVRIEFGDESFLVARAKGTDYLARLLANPGREFHALDLAGETGFLPAAEGGVGPALDAEAKAAYKRRLAELDEDLEEADRFADTERAARARFELDVLAQQLSAAVGMFGRDRAVGTATERARQSVTKAIKAAVARITRQSPAVGRHLSATVRTGSYCAYVPDPPLPWET